MRNILKYFDQIIHKIYKEQFHVLQDYMYTINKMTGFHYESYIQPYQNQCGLSLLT